MDERRMIVQPSCNVAPGSSSAYSKMYRVKEIGSRNRVPKLLHHRFEDGNLWLLVRDSIGDNIVW